MSSVNLHTREIAIKIVYYGPGLGGKTSSLQFIHRALKPDSRGQLISLATGVDRTLFFDFLPVKLPKLRGFTVRVQLYTVPGQVHYNSTRKLVLTGADAVVFVADSQRPRLAANVESMENLAENLAEQGIALENLPLALQLNKRDVPDAAPTAELEARLNPHKFPVFETVATKGTGVFDALKSVTSQALTELRRKGSLPRGADATPTPPARRPKTTPPGSVSAVSPPEDTGPITLSSLGEVADAIEKLTPTDGRSISGPIRAIPSGAARNLSDLVASSTARDGLAAIEGDIERGDWDGAVRHGAAAYREISSKLAGALAPIPSEAPALAALLTNLPAGRYLRYREVTDRVEQGGAVSSTDALFVLFFLTDVALRLEEMKR
ncbi:MAG TPA: GTPase domain-containing protein [Haliangiales bacterium]|nr:GTPase domain-containing protein [Haliangiales bacterium]